MYAIRSYYGFFTFRIADLYPDSRVFALDIEEQMIEEMYDAAECDNSYNFV